MSLLYQDIRIPLLSKASPRRVLFTGLFCLATALILSLPAVAQEETDLFDLLYSKQFDQILQIAGNELESKEISQDRKLDVLRVLATAHLMRHRDSGQENDRTYARTAMETMLRLAPETDFVPGYRYPPAVHVVFHQVRSAQKTDAPNLTDSPPRIAVAPFFQIGWEASDKFDWEAFAGALQVLVASDLEPVPGFTLLSREQYEVISEELALASQAQLVAEENRVRLGKLLSVSSFVYGTVQVAGKDEVTLTVRMVQTETGLSMIAVQGNKRVRSGKHLLELYNEVVIDKFIPKLMEHHKQTQDQAVAREILKQIEQRKIAAEGENYLRYISMVSRAIRSEESGDLVMAMQHWRDAGRALNTDSVPDDRAKALALMIKPDQAADMPHLPKEG